MSKRNFHHNSLEILEARIAPAAVSGPLLPSTSDKFVKATFGSGVEVREGQVLNTDGVANSGSYLLFMEKGNALVYFTDFDNDGTVDYNEMTGISAGNGTRIILFSDLHGDAITNLQETQVAFAGANGPEVRTFLSLTDSDNDPSNGNDGRVVLNNTIEKIEMRTLRTTDIPNQDATPGVDANDVAARRAQTTFSIFGNIYAGKGFGALDGGLLIDSTNAFNFGEETIPTFGSIRTGTAVSGEYFSFGVSGADNVSGTISRFTAPRGQAGADIIGVKTVDPTMLFDFDGLYAGNGGVGARGGNIEGVIVSGDGANGYEIVAGNGGNGPSGGTGGAVLGFSDLSSSTARILIQTGNGGVGSSGSGGDGGTLDFDTFNARGGVQIRLGNGGDGFTVGGAGASLSSGDFTNPATVNFTPGTAYGTTHLPSTLGDYTARLGTHEAVDFDKDGFGDFVFTTRDNSSLVVMFGTGTGGFRQIVTPDGLTEFEKIFLPGVRNAEALVVADLNRDGQMDIAVASVDANAHTDIKVFLSRFEHDGPGTLTGAEDLDGDNFNDFLGFRSPRTSTLPSFGQPHQISSLAAGDFNGDGTPELAVAMTIGPSQSIVFLKADTEIDALTGNPVVSGQFYADFTALGIPVVGIVNAGAETLVIEASALRTGATPSTADVLFVGPKGQREVRTIGYDGAIAAELGRYALGQVDTDREPAEPGNAHRNPENVTLLDFTVLDVTGDGIADVAAIAESPALFMVAVQGDGLGVGTQISGNGADQSGNFFGAKGYDISDELVNIKSVDADGDGVIDDVAVYHVKSGQGRVATLSFPAPPATAATLISNIPIDTDNSPHQAPVMFDVYYPLATDLTRPAYGAADNGGSRTIDFVPDPGPVLPPLTPFSIASVPYTLSFLRISLGDGGDSLVGKGGAGGSIGGGAKVVNIPGGVDPITGEVIPATKDLVGSVNITVSSSISLFAGNGGDGFAGGGRGGDVSGVVTRGTTNTSFVGGDGGRGVAGAGGSGGNVKDSSATGINVTLVGGAGGDGSIGGNGGSVIGNGTAVQDAIVFAPRPTSPILRVAGGDGGLGAKGGGKGGDILNLAPSITADTVGVGTLIYEAGDGGNAVGGAGGNGGSITNSAPRPNAFLGTQVTLTAGNGGSGTKGGAGGDLTNFLLKLEGNSSPSDFDARAGHGGAGFSSDGGKGGVIKDLQVPSRGLAGLNTILAGNGGASAAGKGGTGGNVESVITSTQNVGSFAVVAGAGGHGLKEGGTGGSIQKVDVSMGSSNLAKMLIVAGAGGDATAFIPNSNESPEAQAKQASTAFGGQVGRGGAGGSINGFSQIGATEAYADLIAGNGGSTLNYGTVSDTQTFVGNGGSIKNVTLSGKVGNSQADNPATPLNENVPIKSYNDFKGGESMAQWVEGTLRAGLNQLTDTDGNVGIVVGSAGRNKAAVFLPDTEPFEFTPQPAPNANNGTLENLKAKTLMSAVAGSVDRIASIQFIKNIQIESGSVGADKGGPLPDDGTVGVFDFLDPQGNPSPVPVLDGELIDGIVVAKQAFDGAGRIITLPGLFFRL